MKLKLLKQLNEEQLQRGFGLILDARNVYDRDDFYDVFTGIEVFHGNPNEFKERVIELFKEFLEDYEHEDADHDFEYKNLEGHEMYEDFLEYFWVMDKF